MPYLSCKKIENDVYNFPTWQYCKYKDIFDSRIIINSTAKFYISISYQKDLLSIDTRIFTPSKAEVQITLLFTSVMIQGILGAFCVRVPISYIMSIQPNTSLFHIGLATPMSSILQLILCVGFMLWLQKNRLLDDKH